MHTERIRTRLVHELPHHPLKIAILILSHFSHVPVYCDVDLCTGQKMRVNLSDASHALIALTGDCEPEVTQMMRHSLSRGDTFIDGGANAGVKTAIGYSLVTDTGSVIAFEPTPQTYRLLEYNTTQWSTTAIKTHQLALSDHSDVATLTDFGHRRSGLNTLHSIPRDLPLLKGTAVEITTTTLDEKIGNRNPSLIKLDVEGYERQALIGFMCHLTKYHPDIIFETGNPDTPDVLRLLTSLGYGFFGLINDRLTKIEADIALNILNVLASPKS